jgi:hypothetical protein
MTQHGETVSIEDTREDFERLLGDVKGIDSTRHGGKKYPSGEYFFEEAKVAWDAWQIAISSYQSTIKDKCNSLTKREYFAGLAMQGLLASGRYVVCDETSEEAWSAAESLLYTQDRVDNN